MTSVTVDSRVRRRPSGRPQVSTAVPACWSACGGVEVAHSRGRNLSQRTFAHLDRRRALRVARWVQCGPRDRCPLSSGLAWPGQHTADDRSLSGVRLQRAKHRLHGLRAHGLERFGAPAWTVGPLRGAGTVGTTLGSSERRPRPSARAGERGVAHLGRSHCELEKARVVVRRARRGLGCRRGALAFPGAREVGGREAEDRQPVNSGGVGRLAGARTWPEPLVVPRLEVVRRSPRAMSKKRHPAAARAVAAGSPARRSAPLGA